MSSPPAGPNDSKPRDARNAEDLFVEAYELASRGDSGLWPRATRLFEQAAERGHLEAQYTFAVALRDGHGVEANPTAALVWLRIAAQRGHVYAQNQLGCRLCELSDAAPVLEARSWFERSATGGNGEAMVNLGLYYEEGTGVPRDLQIAATWYRAAARRGVDRAMEGLRRLGEDDSKESLRIADAGEKPRPAPEEPLERLRTRAENGDAHAQAKVASRLLRMGSEGHAREALQWCRRAAEAGQAVAQVNLAMMLETGCRGIAGDDHEIDRWWSRAADLGEPTARQYRSQGEVVRALAVEALRRFGFYGGWTREPRISVNA